MNSNNSKSYSDLSTFSRCPRSYYYRVVNDLEPKVHRVALDMGSEVHENLKNWYLYRDFIVVAAAAEMRLTDRRETEYTDTMAEFDVISEDALRLTEAYVSYYNDEQWTTLHVEEEFLINVGDTVMTFTPDLVVRDGAGIVWVVDHKTTTSRTGLSSYGDLQNILYLNGVREFYPEVGGFIFNYLRKKVPTIPRLATTGNKRVADLGRIDTSYEILYQFLKDNAPDLLDDPAHRHRLAQLRDNAKFFWRDTIYADDDVMANTQKEVLLQLEHLKESQLHQRWPRSFQSIGVTSCDSCSYMSLCRAELFGYDVETVLTNEYQIRAPKNPYEEATDAD